MSDHGTYARYQVHLRQNSEPCQPCRDAAATYARTRRKANPKVYREEMRRDQLHARALRILGRRYPGELAAIRWELSQEAPNE